MRPPVPGRLAQTFARGGEIPGNGMEQKRARSTRRWPLVLADLLVASVVSTVIGWQPTITLTESVKLSIPGVSVPQEAYLVVVFPSEELAATPP